MGFYTYLHCKPDGIPFYVGKGKGRRSTDFTSRNRYHKRIVAKYGGQNILVFVFPCESERQALDDEIQHILQLKGEGYSLANLTDGGEGMSGYIAPPELRKKRSINAIGNKNGCKSRSPETRAKIAASKTGKKRKPFSKEHLEKLKASKQSMSAEWRERLSISAKKRWAENEVL